MNRALTITESNTLYLQIDKWWEKLDFKNKLSVYNFLQEANKISFPSINTNAICYTKEISSILENTGQSQNAEHTTNP